MVKKYLLLPVALLTGGMLISGVQAQDKKEKKEIIIRGDDKGEKTIIMIEGDKVIVNGKEVTGDDKETIIMKRMSTNPQFFMFKTDSLLSSSGDMLKNFDWKGDMPRGDIRMFRMDGDRNTETTEVRAQLGVLTQANEKGVEVVDVTEPSAAAKAGIKKGDLITSVDDKKIENPEVLVEYIRSKKPGDVVRIDLLRNGKKESLKATLGEMRTVSKMRTITIPDGQDRPESIERVIEMMPRNGMEGMPRREVKVEVIHQRPKLGMQVEEQISGKGLKVLEVKPDGAAAKAGLKVGDIVEQIDGQAVNNLDELRTALEKENKSHKMNIIRAGKSMELTVTFLRKGEF
jgi:serine protease Do